MSITKQVLNINADKLAKIHDKLCDNFIALLDSEMAADPKILEAIIRFLNNNDINCAPGTAKTENNQETLKTILAGMKSKLDDELAA